jgi:Tfp pilus assembly protein PilN
MTEQQQHLQQLLQQRSELEAAATKNRELFFKVQGAIEYLTQVGVTLPEPEEAPAESAEAEVVAE